ncbi:NAD-dependent protein deacetylase [Metallosphaera sp. J1]|uniref:NAD-dependent protein deacetylase n=1 Tax=Metallosphaera javensis (ex Hofmann et al. 2022) TaxID=99938 RepID=UPI001EE04F58|nr:NAD-dependent protein deacetylase [Metallosphaera javensis (ex Hofmann et al. 2022)]MCG3109489.1 NAD-dependent protein deacetylase [Metallosphaera javensis (ex Hofmann et al. 2022)]
MELAELLLTSTHGIAFTGAGISTPSGIPDFRGPQGLWKKYPQELSSASYLKSDPRGFWEFYAFRLRAMDSVSPNPAHYALAELERMGLIKYVITQNIDGLHQDAGSRNVIELHGTSRRFYCEECGRQFERREVLEKVQSGELPPRCQCGGLIRPAVVLFDEPVHRIGEALTIAQESDLVLVVGSSLTVYPANLIPQVVKENGGRLVIINMEETPLDHVADLVIRERVEEVLPKTVKRVKEIVGLSN